VARLGRLRRIHAHIPLALLALLLARPSPATNAVGTALIAAGLAVRLWAAGVLEKNRDLCTHGPYRYVRHPLYLGSLLAALGFAVMMNVRWAWLAVLPLFLILYAAQLLAEERLLRQRYGGAHAEYARQVPLLIPLPGRAASGDTSFWRLRRALANREHYHLLFTVLLLVLFYLKHHWLAVRS
jgi:protein-S-isoprenylcysteine O-methyltransferase Ste14